MSNTINLNCAKARAETRILRDIIVILTLVVGIHTIIAKPFYIPSESMMPLLRNGDRLVVSKWPYGWSYRASVSFHPGEPQMQGRIWGKLPEHGDVVVLDRIRAAYGLYQARHRHWRRPP